MSREVVISRVDTSTGTYGLPVAEPIALNEGLSLRPPLDTALAIDIDGVVIDGSRPKPLMTAVKNAFPRNDLFDRLMLQAVRGQKVHPETRDDLALINGQGFQIFGNTGRPDHPHWVEATRETLERGEALHLFQDIYFKDRRHTAEQGKISAVRGLLERYSQVTVIDDSPTEAFAIARAFPNSEALKILVIVKSRTGGLLFSRAERKKHPNVIRIGSLSGVLS